MASDKMDKLLHTLTVIVEERYAKLIPERYADVIRLTSEGTYMGVWLGDTKLGHIESSNIRDPSYHHTEKSNFDRFIGPVLPLLGLPFNDIIEGVAKDYTPLESLVVQWRIQNGR